MMNTMTGEQQTTTALKSPFQLKSSDKPLKILSLPQQSFPTQNGSTSSYGDDSSTTSSTLSETSDVSPKSSVFGASPFSLNVKKVGSVSLSTPSSLTTSPQSSVISSSLNKDKLSPEQKVTELLREIAGLKKDIEAKDAKLSSSVKSIKQFWSPELKKERSARKDEVEKYLLLKEKYKISNSQNEEYRKTLEDLESELNSQQKQINELSGQLKECKAENTSKLDLEKEVVAFKKERSQKDDEVLVLSKTIDDLEAKYKQLEAECDDKDHCIHDLEIILVDYEKKEKEYEQNKQQIETLYETITSCENEIKRLENENEKCKGSFKTSEKVSELEESLSKQEELYVKAMIDVENLHKKDEENVERINELEEMFLVKDKEFDKIQAELSALQISMEEKHQYEISASEIEQLKELLQAKEDELSNSHKQEKGTSKDVDIKNQALQIREKLDDVEKCNKELQEQLDKDKSNPLDDIVTQKNREIQDLTAKYEKLDKYLSNREEALESCREELKEVKTKYSNVNVTKEQLENQLYEQKTLLERLEKQKERTRSKDESVSVTIHNEIKLKNEKLQSTIAELQDETNALRKSLDEKEEKLKLLPEKTKKIEKLEKDIKELQQTNKTLDDELKTIKSLNEKQQKELEDLKKRLNQSESNRSRTSSEGRSASPVKESKATKHLWDELSKKEIRIEELEKQMKEKNKQIATFKKTQNAEKKEQLQLVNETQKNETNEKLQQLQEKGTSQDVDVKNQEEMEKRDQRVTMLEEALRESVCIAAEREEILARHVEISEDASKKVVDAESEYDRVVVEKAITNIKNAFLILSLSERDALIASMKAARKRIVEESMNIKQETLLSSISEKDTQIAHLELQPNKKRQEIKQLKSEKEMFVKELKEQNNIRMKMMNHDNKENLIQNELKDAPPTQIYEAIRHLSNSSSKLEFYVEELMAFLREKNVELLCEMATLPRKKARPYDQLKKASKNELMKELVFVEDDSMALKSYVDKLLDKLEGPQS